jgi:hypothetical protein
LRVSELRVFRARLSHQASAYLATMNGLRASLDSFRPDIILYQAGADTHVDDPLGGLLTSDQMRERDRIMFSPASCRFQSRGIWPVAIRSKAMAPSRASWSCI